MVKSFKKAGPNVCPNCSSGASTTISYSDTVDFRGLVLDVEGLQISRCDNCARKWTTEAQDARNDQIVREAYATERDRLRAEQGLLSGEEIARIRTGFRLNQREAAKLFGGGFNAFNKYESGEVLQSAAMDRLLRLAQAVGPLAIDFLRNVKAPPPFITLSRTHFIVINASVNFGTPSRTLPTVKPQGNTLLRHVVVSSYAH